MLNMTAIPMDFCDGKQWKIYWKKSHNFLRSISIKNAFNMKAFFIDIDLKKLCDFFNEFFIVCRRKNPLEWLSYSAFPFPQTHTWYILCGHKNISKIWNEKFGLVIQWHSKKIYLIVINMLGNWKLN